MCTRFESLKSCYFFPIWSNWALMDYQWISTFKTIHILFPKGHPSSEPGLTCANLNAGKASKWESSSCDKKLGYICRKGNSTSLPTIPSKYIPNNQTLVYVLEKVFILTSAGLYIQAKTSPASAPVTGFHMQITVTTWRGIKRFGGTLWLHVTKRVEILPAYTTSKSRASLYLSLDTVSVQ